MTNDARNALALSARRYDIIVSQPSHPWPAGASHLYTAGMSDPDLLIRTAGEMRISNFLLWQISYAEIWVTSKCWPEFRRDDLFEAFRDFASRQRRFGGLAE